MNSEIENTYGYTLQLMVTHLIKNAFRNLPPSVYQGALDFESFAWGKLDDATKRARASEIAAETGNGTTIQRHFEAYPHKFSKKCFARFLSAQEQYRAELGS